MEVGLAYRSLTAGEWFVGRDVHEEKAPFGKPLFLNIQSADLTLNYGATERLLDREFGSAGGGDLAKYLFFFGIDRRF